MHMVVRILLLNLWSGSFERYLFENSSFFAPDSYRWSTYTHPVCEIVRVSYFEIGNLYLYYLRNSHHPWFSLLLLRLVFLLHFLFLKNRRKRFGFYSFHLNWNDGIDHWNLLFCDIELMSSMGYSLGCAVIWNLLLDFSCLRLWDISWPLRLSLYH